MQLYKRACMLLNEFRPQWESYMDVDVSIILKCMQADVRKAQPDGSVCIIYRLFYLFLTLVDHKSRIEGE